MTETELVPIESITPNPRNPRTHSDAQIAKIAASLSEFDWINPILVDENGTIIAGRGRYLADIAGCHGCHGTGLSGGPVAGPPGLPPASNLTTAGIGDWTEADFVRAMRNGRRPDGSSLDPFMPWEVFGKMTDDELHALWLYLRSVPARAFGNKD